MTAAQSARLEAFFTAYAGRYAGPDGALPPMQQLKARHSRLVADAAQRVASALQWPAPRRRLGVAAALLHDIGRFSQFATHGTFDDRLSINHATRGCEVLEAERALDVLAADEAACVLTSVRLHNVRDVPDGLPGETAACVHLVRDADKLDIFRVFDDAIREGHLEAHPEIALSLDLQGRPDPELLARVRDGRPADYRMIRSLCDMLLIQVGWLTSQFHYRAALALAADRQTLEFREAFVRGMADSADVRACFAAARAAMAARLSGGGR